jgi:hypothetical protein
MRNEITKFLRFILKNDSQNDKDIEFSGIYFGRIPSDLVDPKAKGGLNLVIQNEELRRFNNLKSGLRSEVALEYLKDQELHDALWYLLCDVTISRDKYLDNTILKNRVEAFCNQIFKPIDDYEVIHLLRNFNVNSGQLSLWGFTIRHFAVEDLIALGFDKDHIGEDTFLASFSNCTALIIREKGNNPTFIEDRSRALALYYLRQLRMYLSYSPLLRDEHLLFEIQGLALIRNLKTNQIICSGRAIRRPLNTFYNENLSRFLDHGSDHYNAILKYSPRMKAVVDRAIHWFGTAIEQETFDQKIIALSTFLEVLLTQKDDGRKGEAITYRMALLNSIAGAYFVDPMRILWLYEIRSSIIHGSTINCATSIDYQTLLMTCQTTLSSFIKLVGKWNIKKPSELIKFLETSDESSRFMAWLKESGDTKAQEIANSLQKAIDSYR